MGHELASNDYEGRSTPPPLGDHRVWGDDALNLMNRHPGLALPFPTVFLGQEFSSDDVAQPRLSHPGYALPRHGTRGSVLMGQPLGDSNRTVVSAELAVGMLVQHAVHSIALEKNERAA